MHKPARQGQINITIQSQIHPIQHQPTKTDKSRFIETKSAKKTERRADSLKQTPTKQIKKPKRKSSKNT